MLHGNLLGKIENMTGTFSIKHKFGRWPTSHGRRCSERRLQ